MGKLADRSSGERCALDVGTSDPCSKTRANPRMLTSLATSSVRRLYVQATKLLCFSRLAQWSSSSRLTRGRANPSADTLLQRIPEVLRFSRGPWYGIVPLLTLKIPKGPKKKVLIRERTRSPTPKGDHGLIVAKLVHRDVTALRCWVLWKFLGNEGIKYCRRGGGTV